MCSSDLFEEAIHTHAYQYIVESLGLDEGEIFNAYQEIASIRDKDEFLIPFINILTDPEFQTGTIENDQKLLRSLIAEKNARFDDALVAAGNGLEAAEREIARSRALKTGNSVSVFDEALRTRISLLSRQIIILANAGKHVEAEAAAREVAVCLPADQSSSMKFRSRVRASALGFEYELHAITREVCVMETPQAQPGIQLVENCVPVR